MGIMEEKMETTIVYRDYINLMIALHSPIADYSSFHFLFHYPHINPNIPQ